MEKEQKIEIKNGIRIIDYSKGKGDLHIKFQWKGEEDDPNDDSQFTGGHMEFKFKDPRDALKELVKNWKLYDIEISLKLLDYVNYGTIIHPYTPMQVYYTTILNFQIYYTAEFIACNPPLPEIRKDMPKEELDLYNKLVNEYEEELNTQTRISHIWAVKNTWWSWDLQTKFLQDSYPSKDNPYPKGGYARKLNEDKSLIFCEDYKGKKIKYATGFLLNERLWRVVFEDESWIICEDVGNGWYKAMTDFDSYKINLPYRS